MTERERSQWILAQELLRERCADAGNAAVRGLIETRGQHVAVAVLMAIRKTPIVKPSGPTGAVGLSIVPLPEGRFTIPDAAPMNVDEAPAAPERPLPSQVLRAGCITLLQWTMMPDGETYMHVWSPAWRVVTDAQCAEILGTPFRSSERWQLFALDAPESDVALAVIPGCQVKGIVFCRSTPNVRSVYSFNPGDGAVDDIAF